MRTSDFYYELPQELIAQDPLEDRSSSRLMHLSMADGSIEHRHFRDILDYLNEGDTLVINDTKVIPARLYGHKEETGAVIEILLLKRRENDIWECLVKPGKKARPGAKITFGDGILEGEIIDVVDEGNRLIQFHYEGIFEEILEKGVHYVEVALNEVPLFIRSGKCIPVAEAAECVKDIDTSKLTMLGYEGSSYTLYEDDGVHKEYDKAENYRKLEK